MKFKIQWSATISPDSFNWSKPTFPVIVFILIIQPVEELREYLGFFGMGDFFSMEEFLTRFI